MQVRKLSEVPREERDRAEAVMFVGLPVMLEQREVHRNAQEVHGVRRYAEVVHCHPVEQDCRGLCEFWSPDA